ncbi:MAG: hypothetical protein P8Y64_13250 [Gammaproteobacteria bacterium]
MVLAAWAIFALLPGGAAASQPTPRLIASTTEATAGYFKLSWRPEKPQDEDFVLQKSATPDFQDAHTIYNGPDTARFISGLKNGDYYFRIQAVAKNSPPSAWSKPVHIEVNHHSLERAFAFFGVGGTVFFATLGTILIGTRRSAREQDEGS